jgi:general secretion pathway protein F
VSVSYRYRASTSAGEMVEGVLHAATRETALEELHRQRLYPVAVDIVAPPAAGRASRKRRVGRHLAVALWTRNISILLAAGVPLDRALGFTAAQAEDPALGDAIRRTRRLVQEGSSLAEALSSSPGFFPSVFVAMVSAGEASGTLDLVFERLAEHLEESADLRAQVRSALLYPALMAVVASLGVTVLLVFVVPRFAAILGDFGGRLPLSTRALMGVSGVLTQWWWLWIALLIAGVIAARAVLNQPAQRRRFHAWRLRLPWIGDLELKYATAGITRTLGLLLRSGVPILSALRIARASSTNESISAGVERATVSVSHGDTLASALGGTLPPLALQMLSVGEETGHLDELSLRVADTYDREVKRSVRAGVSMIEPAMILIFGALVGFVALAMLQAIYSINTTAF